MLQTIAEINDIINGLVWGAPAMICIIGVGILLSVRTGFIQFRKFPYAIKSILGKLLSKDSAGHGAMTPFQAVCTALASTVGTGNIAGVAGAIAIGGPGAVFWMWISALLGMCTKFAEVVLAVHFRERNAQGDYVGGPMYYIKNGLHKRWHFLAALYALFAVITVFGTGNATQVNTIVASVNTALLSFNLISPEATKTVAVIIGIVCAVIVALVLLGGIKRIGKVTETLVPFMALLYIALGLGVIILNAQRIPTVFSDIFNGAFNPHALTSSAEQNPLEQGFFGIFEVFTDTIVICTLTALTILLSGVPIEYGVAAGAELTISGFVATYGNWVSVFTAVAMCCFAFSTILGWGLYGARALEFLSSDKLIKPFMIAYSLVAIVGATMDLGLMWGIADTCNGIMAIPNLIALFLLSGKVVELVKNYEGR